MAVICGTIDIPVHQIAETRPSGKNFPGTLGHPAENWPASSKVSIMLDEEINL